ncbi:hypothetical protein ACN47E_002407 [Coniothyrium glycines]
MLSLTPILLSLSTYIALATSSPTPLRLSTRQTPPCLDPSAALSLATTFADLVGAYTPAKADAVLLATFTDHSDAINSLRGAAPGSVTFDGREAFKAAQTGHGGVPMEVDAVVGVTCDTVVWRWHAVFGAGTSVRGINVNRYVRGEENASGGWWVERVDMEMNALAYVENVGGEWSVPRPA